jgi:hypothetical protein
MSNGARILAGLGVTAAAWLALAPPASSEVLFKIVTVRDEIVIGLNDDELATLRGTDAGAVAAAIAAKGSLTLWQYAVKRAPDGSMQMAPLRKVGVLANASLRVEPYTTPYKIMPHD